MEGRSAPWGPQCQLPLFEGDEGDLLGGYQLMMFLSQPQKIPPKTPERDQSGREGEGAEGGYRFGIRFHYLNTCSMRKSLNLLCLGFLICTHPCRLLCDRMKVKHFIQGLGCRNYCERAGSWSIHHPGGGAEGQLCSRSQPVAGPCGYTARAHGRTLVLPNNLQFWASVKWKVQSS